MFLLNFYSNENDYIVLFLAGVFVSIFLFFLSMSFNSKRFFFLFLSSVIASLMINVNQFPLWLIFIVSVVLIYFSYRFEGGIKYKIFTNLVSIFIFGVLVVSGVFSLRSYLNDSINEYSSNQKIKKNDTSKKNLRIEIDKDGKVIN
jgi:hypothetical protein